MPVFARCGVNEAFRPHVVQIEGTLGSGFSGIQLLGNVGDIVKNGLDRARAALEGAGLQLSQRRTIISMSPAEIRKDGSQFDLALAVCLAQLVAPEDQVRYLGDWLFAAELGLDGTLKPVRGAIGYGIAAAREGLTGMVVATENAADLSVIGCLGQGGSPLKVVSCTTLRQVLDWVASGFDMELTAVCNESAPGPERCEPDFADMWLDEMTRSAALVAATGFHNILLAGTPGCGKSMLAHRLPALLPRLLPDDHLEVLVHHSLVHAALPAALVSGLPPFRNPHHQSSVQAVLGSTGQPGEMCLAHGGILFLDEACEFRRDIIEALREPLETGQVSVSRAQQKVTWDARFMLVLALNNCPCGWLGSRFRQCRCSMRAILNYRRKLSGPILDRVDLHVNVPEPGEQAARMFGMTPTEDSQQLRDRVAAGREFGLARNKKFSIVTNNQLQARHLLAASGLDRRQFDLLIESVVEPGTSYRGLAKTIRVARTLADMDRSVALRREHVVQAWQWQVQQARCEYAYGA